MGALLRKAGAGLLILAGLVLGPLPAGGRGPAEALMVCHTRGGWCRQIGLGGMQRLTIRFFHSYDRQWVEESFGWQKGRFIPTRVSFRDDSYDYREQRYRCRPVVKADRILLTALQPRPSDALPQIILRVAHIKTQWLIISGPRGSRSWPLTTWGRPGERLVLSLKR